jgi:hypothetical protein
MVPAATLPPGPVAVQVQFDVRGQLPGGECLVHVRRVLYFVAEGVLLGGDRGASRHRADQRTRRAGERDGHRGRVGRQTLQPVAVVRQGGEVIAERAVEEGGLHALRRVLREVVGHGGGGGHLHLGDVALVERELGAPVDGLGASGGEVVVERGCVSHTTPSS